MAHPSVEDPFCGDDREWGAFFQVFQKRWQFRYL